MEVNINKIKIDDTTFRFSYGFDLEPLVLSITASGIVNPLLVKQKGRSYGLICGYRRYRAAQKLGLKKVLVHEFKGSDLEAFRLALLENIAVRNFNTIEKALILRSLLSLNVPLEDILAQYCQFLDIAPKKGTVQDHLALLQLEEYWQEQLAGGKLMLDTGVLLTRWSANDRDALAGFLQKYQFNLNKGREFITWLDEIMLRDKTNVTRTVDRLTDGADQVTQNDQRFELFRKALRAIRYPTLSSAERKWVKNVQELQLPDGINVIPPRDFEGDTVSVQFTIKNKQEVIKKTIELQKAFERTTADGLFQ